MSNIVKTKEKGKIDWFVTVIPVMLVALMGVTIAFFPDTSAAMFGALRALFVNELGWLFMAVGLVMLGVSFWIAFSRFGRIKLGNLDKPRYNDFSWAAMIFTSMAAADVLYWSLIEWAYYYMEDPFGLGLSRTAAEVQDLVSAYPLFHWGLMGWVFYILPAAALGFMIFVKKRKKETLSEACRPILGNRVNGWLGRVIDIFCIAGLLAGCATIFSLATPMISACFSGATGVPDSKWLTIGILLVVAVVFTISCLKGMKAISWVANQSVYIYLILLLVVLIVSDIRYTVDTGLTAMGFVADNFFKMTTWMDPLRVSGADGYGFPQNWTVFFYANWISWSVATPMFIAKISEGRTLRNTIIGGYAYGIAATYLSFIIFGNYSLNLEVTNQMAITSMLEAGSTIPQVIVEIVNTLPAPKIIMMVIVVVMIALYATTFDATTMVLAGFSEKRRKLGTEPSTPTKIFWSVVLILLPVAMVFAESILSTMQTVTTVAAFPIMIIEIIIMVGFIKELRSIGVKIPVPPMGKENAELKFDPQKYEKYLEETQEE